MEGTYAALDKLSCHRPQLDHQIEILYRTHSVTDEDDMNKSLAHLLPETSADHWKRTLFARGVDPQTGGLA